MTGGPLPKVELRWLQQYYQHLAVRLSFPFTAQYPWEGRGLRPLSVSVVTLLDPEQRPSAAADGLICAVDDGSRQRELPLIDIEVESENPNFQLLDDYWYWFWNWRFDPRI